MQTDEGIYWMKMIEASQDDIVAASLRREAAQLQVDYWKKRLAALENGDGGE